MDKFEYHKRMTADRDLSHAEHRLLATLWDYSDPDGTNIRPGRERMVDHSTLGERTVRVALNALLDRGYLVKTTGGGRGKGGRGLATIYRLSIPQAWITGTPTADEDTDTGSQCPPFDHETGTPTADPWTRNDTPRPERGTLTAAEGGPPLPAKGGTQGPPTRSLPDQTTRSSPIAANASVDRPSTQAMHQLPDPIQEQAVDIIQKIAQGIEEEQTFETFLERHVSAEAADYFSQYHYDIPGQACVPYGARKWFGTFMNTARALGHYIEEGAAA